LDSPRIVGHGRGHPLAGGLADGEDWPVSAASAPVQLTGGVEFPHEPACLSHPARACAQPQVYSAFSAADFKKELEMIFRIYVNALENHNLLILAPKIVKQILVDFLGVDLWFKNIA
jgi:hypothetical protein